ncbi:hypothetical protein ESU54_17160 [Aequorivita antarctica]|uniref:Uncharacterized protein n=1 Tax=Aequorivita antarctica TaxID=153266 RepID=A0A5C6YUV1_9FLAO|nr:hypothetical protein ESU54_17160 [Aequorivita antarctica]
MSKTVSNIVLAIAGLKVVNSIIVILSGIGANIELTFSKCPIIAHWRAGACTERSRSGKRVYLL